MRTADTIAFSLVVLVVAIGVVATALSGCQGKPTPADPSDLESRIVALEFHEDRKYLEYLPMLIIQMENARKRIADLEAAQKQQAELIGDANVTLKDLVKRLKLEDCY